MKERPILFSAPMVRAILDGRKTQTRRVIADRHLLGGPPEDALLKRCPYGHAGDRLWVKETFSAHGAFGPNGRKSYRADIPSGKEPHGLHWKPSIFMPRAASRITLDVVSVRVERLNVLGALDAMAEGIEPMNYSGQDFWKNYQFKANTPGIYVKAFRWQVDSYRTLWESINGAESWASNPWVWVVEFRRITL